MFEVLITDYLAVYTENAKATDTKCKGRPQSERQLSDTSSSIQPQLSQSTFGQPIAQDSRAPLEPWLEGTQLQAGVRRSSGTFQPESPQEITKLSTHQSLQSGPAEQTEGWMWPHTMLDQNMSAAFLFGNLSQDSILNGGDALQTFDADAMQDGAGAAHKPISPLENSQHQPHREKSPGTLSQLKKLLIPKPHRFREYAKNLPLRPPQPLPSFSGTAQQSSTSMSRQSSIQGRSGLSTQPVPNLKRTRRTDSTSSRSPVSKKACGSIERANSLNKLRDLHSKLYVAERERDSLVDFVKEFREEVEKWDVDDDSAGEVQHLIDIFNMGLKKVRHLL